MAQLALVNAYEKFMATAHAFVNIRSEVDYHEALVALEEIMESAGDTKDDPLDPLIEMLSRAIEEYESQDDELIAFVREADAIPLDAALVRTLMQQHQLTGSELPEIGDKIMISKVLNGKRQLTRLAIERLSARLGIRPAIFFGETE